jgi:hypothetical protein
MRSEEECTESCLTAGTFQHFAALECGKRKARALAARANIVTLKLLS